jgi:tetratricopeptide (TPR) repeat protein
MRPYILCSLLAVSLFITSCQQRNEQPVSKEEALAFAKSLDSSIAAGNKDYFMEQLHMEVLFERIEKISNVPMTSDLKRGMKEGFKQGGSIGEQIIRETGNGKGSYSIVRQYEKDKKQHVIFRLYGDNGLNYHDFELIKFNNKVFIADFLIYMTGENFSQSLGDLLEGLMEAEKDKKGQGVAPGLSLIKRLIAQNKHREAQKVYSRLPAAIKQRKAAQIINLSICSGLGVEEYEKALVQFELKYRDEPTMSLSLMDIYFLRKDYPGTMNVVNRIDSMIGGDPFLDYYRGLVYYNWGKPGESREALEKMYARYPQFGKGTIELIHNYLTAGDYEKARSLIAAYRESDNFDQELLETNLELYPDFKE